MGRVVGLLSVVWFVAANVYAASLVLKRVAALPVFRECHGAIVPVCVFQQLCAICIIGVCLTFWAGALVVLILWCGDFHFQNQR